MEVPSQFPPMPVWQRLAPFVLATFKHFADAAFERRLTGRKGCWSLYHVSDGRALWITSTGEEISIRPGQALLVWRGVGGLLRCPQGACLRGVVFDVVPRPREPHPSVGWRPLAWTGTARQPTPAQLFAQAIPNVLDGARGEASARLLERICLRWWRSEADQRVCSLALAGWLGMVADALDSSGGGPIERAEVYARQCLGHQPCRMLDMAREVGMRPSTFADAYRHARGESPGAFLRQLRLTYAATALRESDTPIAEIARSSGYASARAFSRAFKEFAGLPPLRYRSQVLQA